MSITAIIKSFVDILFTKLMLAVMRLRIVQEAFARLIEMDLKDVQNPRALLYKTSYNIAIDQKRHGGVCQRLLMQFLMQVQWSKS